MAKKIYEPGQVLHLVKKISHHMDPGSGMIATVGLHRRTHVTVMVLGVTVDAIPTEDEIKAMASPLPSEPIDELYRLDWYHRLVRTCSTAAAKVAVALDARCSRRIGECWPTIADIASDSGQCRRTVQRGIAELEQRGFIHCDRPSNQGRGMVTCYTIKWSAGIGKADPPQAQR